MRRIQIFVVVSAALGAALPAAAATVQIKVPTVHVNVKTPTVTTHFNGVVGKTTLPSNTHELTNVQQNFQKIEVNQVNSGKVGGDNWNATTGGNSGSPRDAATGQASGKRMHKPFEVIRQ